MSDLKAEIRDKYGRLARGGGCCSGPGTDPVTCGHYGPADTAGLPASAVGASLGCGNPVALADLRDGDVVLDLGSGAGLDVLLSARRVGPRGRVIGLDMTDEMLAAARENARRSGAANVEFLKGEIEAIPLPDASVDVVLSNCVINLSTDKPRVLAEAFRVLRPGGRFAVHDIVTRGEVAPEVRRSVEAWIGCLAGALDEDDYGRLLRQAGFVDVEIVPTRVYSAADAVAALGPSVEPLARQADGVFRSAFIRGRKP